MDGLVTAVSKLNGGKTVWNDIRKLTDLFLDADTFGSLITIPDDLAARLPDISSVLAGDPSGHDDLFSYGAEQEAGILVPVVRQAMILAGTYDCVVANPPYMGTKGMNPQLKEFLRINFPDVKSDLFAAFIVRNCAFTEAEGYLGFMTPFVWMFISSYEKLRTYLINEKTITSLIQLEYSGFDGATVPICTFTLANEQLPDFKGGYVRLSDFRGAAIQGEKALEIIQAARKAGK
jgi:hypothetical protein